MKGLWFIARNKTVLGVCMVLVVMLFLDGAEGVILLVITKQILQKTDFHYGVITTVKGVGMALASISAMRWVKRKKQSNMQTLCCLGYIKILMVFLMAYSRHYMFLALIVFLEAYFWVSMTIIESIILQSELPPEYRGSVYAFYGSLCWMAGFVGTLLFGMVADHIAIPAAVTIEATLAFGSIILIHSKMKKREKAPD
ncbi:MAG: MFS transporter [Lachnospiraceae bacterium]|nr:MFS transporter [Lachnospiraceae bacterium]